MFLLAALLKKGSVKKSSANNANTATRLPGPRASVGLLLSLLLSLPFHSASLGTTHRVAHLPPVTDLGVCRVCPHRVSSSHITGKPCPPPPWQGLGGFPAAGSHCCRRSHCMWLCETSPKSIPGIQKPC